MSSTLLTSLRWVLALPALALALCGCTDHGPVGIYSQELFNRSIPPPRLDFASTNQVSFTANVDPLQAPGVSSKFSAYVAIANFGSSSTYGPVVATFSASDANFLLVQLNSSGVEVASGGMSIGISDNTPGKEIPANSTSQHTLSRGFLSGGQPIVFDTANSYQARYAGPAPYTGAIHTVTIYMVLKDAIGNSWNSQFTVYVTT